MLGPLCLLCVVLCSVSQGVESVLCLLYSYMKHIVLYMYSKVPDMQVLCLVRCVFLRWVRCVFRVLFSGLCCGVLGPSCALCAVSLVVNVCV